ncbi:MAG: hypothetical protein ACI8TQ_002424 [Planctomycetota bacterium]|jgi:hypothetical protein
MNERTIASIVFFELMVLAMTFSVIVKLGFVDFSRTDAAIGDAKDRWALLLERTAPLHWRSESKLDELRAALPTAVDGDIEQSVLASDLTPAEQLVVRELLVWFETVSPYNLGIGDGFALHSLATFAVRIHPPIALPIDKVVAMSDGVLQSGHAVDAIVSLNTIEQMLQFAQRQGLSPNDLPSLRRPTSIDLTRALMRAPLDIIETYKRTLNAELTSSSNSRSSSDSDGLLSTWKQVAIDLGEQYWERRHDLQLLKTMPVDEAPYSFVIQIADLLELQTPHVTLAQSRLASRTASIVEQWESALNRRETIIRAMNATASNETLSD